MITRESVGFKFPVQPLAEVAEFLDNRRKPVKESERKPGPFPYYGANGQQGTIDDYIFDEPLILLAEDGGFFDQADRGIAYRISGKTWVNNHAHVIRPRKGVDLAYLCRVLENYDVTPYISGSTRAKLTKGQAEKIEIPLPPLEEQKRIAAILDQADELRRKRQRALDRLNQLGQAIFIEMFGDLIRNDKAWPNAGTLGDYADIASGITKGRDPKGRPTRPVPYLAVVNVQDKRLQLDAPKKIEATEDEILRYRLQSGDLLLTEGGDPDKLGRGTLWNAELPECIHQNHVFRVRLSSKKYNPTFLNWLVGSAYGKKYFLKAAKQTTGIASINMSQLKAFPMLLPPIDLQDDFARWLDDVRAATEVLASGVRSSEKLFLTLQHRAFRGELTASSLREAAA